MLIFRELVNFLKEELFITLNADMVYFKVGADEIYKAGDSLSQIVAFSQEFKNV